jgi:hypothetical protein
MGLANIETAFERIAKALECIADAAEKAIAPRTKPVPADLEVPLQTGAKVRTQSEQSTDIKPDTSIAYEAINKAVLGYSDRYGQAAAIELLKRFGAKIIKDLKANPDKYAEVLEAIEAGPP